MRRSVLLIVAVCALVLPSAASACSYALPPGLTPAELDAKLLRGSDAAFVGRLVAIVPTSDNGPFGRADYLFRIERRVKGRLPLAFAVVRATIGGSACGIDVEPGQRTGLMVDRRRGAWRADLLSQISPRALLLAARRY